MSELEKSAITKYKIIKYTAKYEYNRRGRTLKIHIAPGLTMHPGICIVRQGNMKKRKKKRKISAKIIFWSRKYEYNRKGLSDWYWELQYAHLK